METNNVPVIMAWGQSLLDGPPLGPLDFCYPVLWAVGTEDKPVVQNAPAYGTELQNSSVQLHWFEGLDHGQVMDEIDQVFPIFLDFLGS